VNIGAPFKEMLKALQYTEMQSSNNFFFTVTDALLQNLAPRLRMAALYAVAQGIPEGGRVINTCNRSEDYVGYSTKYGDSAGDVAPLAAYTVDEVLSIGEALNLPLQLVHKAPSDGLCGKTDEDNLGFTYAMLDKYIKTGICDNPDTKAKIDRLHRLNKHKLTPMPVVER
jgi:NAD+ synthase